MSERDSTLDPASTRRRDDEEIFVDDRELEKARRLVKRNEAYLKQIREHRDKANDADDGRNQSNDVQTTRRGRGNNSQQSREAGTHRTVGDMEYRRAQKTLHKSREILRKMRGEKDEDGEQNNYDPQEEESERNSEFSGYSNRTYNSDVLKKLYPSRESRKSRRERQFSRNDDHPERDHRDQRGASHRRRESGFGGRGLPAGNFDRFRRDVPTDPAAAEQPRRPAADPSAADVEPPAGRSEPALMPGRREARAPVVIPEMEHTELIDWDYFKFRCVDMMNRQGPHFLKIEEISLSAVSNRDIENVRAYGIALKRAIDELLSVFMDCLKGDAPGLRKTLLKDFERFLEQYTFNGYNTFESYPGGRWRFLTKEEFDRIKDIIQPSPPPPRSSGNDGGPSGGAGGLPDDSDRHRSGRNDGGVGPAAAGRGRESPAAMIHGRQRRPMDPDREARIKREQAKQMEEFEQGFRRNSEPTRAAGPAPASGPPADGGGRDFASPVVPGGEIVPASNADGSDSRADVEPVYERARGLPLPNIDESDSDDGSGSGRILDGERPGLVPPSDQIVYEKGDSGENQGYSGLPDGDETKKEESSGLFNRFRHGAKQVVNRLIRRRQGAQAFRGRSITENQKNREAQGRREHQEFVYQRVIRRLRAMGHPQYQSEAEP